MRASPCTPKERRADRHFEEAYAKLPRHHGGVFKTIPKRIPVWRITRRGIRFPRAQRFPQMLR